MKNFTDAEANYNLATIFIARNKDFSKDEAAEVYSKHGFVIGLQCDINTRKGLPCKWNTAIRSLESAVALTQSPVDYSNLGWAYYKSGKLDIDMGKVAEGRAKLEKAKINLQKVVDLNPPYKYIEAPLLNLGMTLLGPGRLRGGNPVSAARGGQETGLGLRALMSLARPITR